MEIMVIVSIKFETLFSKKIRKNFKMSAVSFSAMLSLMSQKESCSISLDPHLEVRSQGMCNSGGDDDDDDDDDGDDDVADLVS